jgi:hypothetical protein
VKVVGFEAAFRRGASGSRVWNTRRGHANNAFVVAHADAEFYGGALGAPPGVRRSGKEALTQTGWAAVADFP